MSSTKSASLPPTHGMHMVDVLSRVGDVAGVRKEAAFYSLFLAVRY